MSPFDCFGDSGEGSIYLMGVSEFRRILIKEFRTIVGTKQAMVKTG